MKIRDYVFIGAAILCNIDYSSCVRVIKKPDMCVDNSACSESQIDGYMPPDPDMCPSNSACSESQIDSMENPLKVSKKNQKTIDSEINSIPETIIDNGTTIINPTNETYGKYMLNIENNTVLAIMLESRLINRILFIHKVGSKAEHKHFTYIGRRIEFGSISEKSKDKIKSKGKSKTAKKREEFTKIEFTLQEDIRNISLQCYIGNNIDLSSNENHSEITILEEFKKSIYYIEKLSRKKEEKQVSNVGTIKKSSDNPTFVLFSASASLHANEVDLSSSSD
ncbi:hypothetical protein NEMIN01_1468 [Nematocida minor]|uniref:uncharacterized protein n=1 Tax=Nematocida minor TaxID=1912983 RepID=UPI00222100DD|nr:uncharacterized protein NEMIN01_1468 [Nematocida minor]KAI5191309.1 hypothetical protein NEMIN01_1468 [Nematocida minor]